MTFSSELKSAEDVENYRQVTILPNFSKIYEMYLYDQMYKYFNHILSKWQCGLKKALAHNTVFLR